MNSRTIVGFLIAGVGAFILIQGLTYGSSRSVMRIGDVQASVEERHAIPPWVGGVAVVGGLIVVGTGMRRRRGA